MGRGIWIFTSEGEWMLGIILAKGGIGRVPSFFSCLRHVKKWDGEAGVGNREWCLYLAKEEQLLLALVIMTLLTY